MKRTWAARAAVPLAAAISLSGCGGDAKPGPSSSSTPAASPTTSSPATPSPTTDPNIPAAARAHTPAGAEAFVRYFYSQLNVAWSAPKSGLISALSLPACKTCAALEGTTGDLLTKGHHYRGDAFAVKSVGSIGEFELIVVGTQPPGAVVDSSGSIIKSRTKSQPIRFNVTVTWSSDSWHIREIQVMQ